MHESAVTPPVLSAGDRFRRLLAILLPMAVVVTLGFLIQDVEYLIGCFPICCVLGLAMALAVWPLGSWRVFLVAQSSLAAVAVCSLLIAGLNLSPGEAQWPITALWALFTLAWAPHAVLAAREVWRWRRAAHQSPMLRWQFQIKFLLAMTTLLSVLLAALKQMHSANLDFMFFAYGSAGLILLMGFAFSLFWARLQAERDAREESSLARQNRRG